MKHIESCFQYLKDESSKTQFVNKTQSSSILKYSAVIYSFQYNIECKKHNV